MSKLRPKNGNLGPLEVLLVIIFLGLAGFIGWFIYYTQQVANENYAAANTASQATPAKAAPAPEKTVTLSKTYADTNGNFTVQYPAGWKVKTAKDTNPDFSSVTTTITSPKGTVLHLDSNNGGKGGSCEPGTNDEPFAKGNVCPSIEYLSSETLPINNVYNMMGKTVKGSYSSSLKKSKVVLVTSHYLGVDGKESYSVNVQNSDTEFPVELNKPTTGAVMSANSLSVYGSTGKFHPYVYAYSQGTTAAFLDSADATTLKAILRTLTFLLPD